MYKISYYLNSGAIRFKAFETLHEATAFANELKPADSVIQIEYYDNVDNRKSNRN